MANKADQDHLDAIHALPCVCCLKMKVRQPSPTEAHHLVDNGYRRLSGGHQATASICGWHHRAEPLIWGTAVSRKYMLTMYGPSMKYQGRKGAFEEEFGTQRDLLNKTNELLGIKHERTTNL